jgi:hypothetical protein
MIAVNEAAAVSATQAAFSALVHAMESGSPISPDQLVELFLGAYAEADAASSSHNHPAQH